jgi:5-methylcytosine-specific restriction endonuclease McrA
MPRREFSKPVRRDALKRSGMLCEAVGAFYGLDDGARCNASLSYGVQFDHIIADGIGGEPTLENCAAVCIRCHDYKTARTDTPRVAEMKRQRDKHNGIRLPKGRPMPGTRASGVHKRMDGTVEKWR